MRFLLSLLNIPFAYLRLLPRRIYRLLKDLLVLPYLIRPYNSFNIGTGHFFRQMLVRAALWPAQIALKVFDLSLLPELFDLLMLLLKPNSRSMTNIEISEAKKVFGSSLPYKMIRIDEKSLMAVLGARVNKNKHLGFVLFRTVNFTRKLDSRPANNDMAWLIHELVHVWQAEHIGTDYIPEALHAQKTSGYGYGGTETLKKKWELEDFNREQQADIIRNAYRNLNSENSIFYEKYLKAIRNPKW